MNRTIQRLVPVPCPKCGKKSMIAIDVITTVDFDGSHDIKGRYTPRPACTCEELKKAMEEAYDKTTF